MTRAEFEPPSLTVVVDLGTLPTLATVADCIGNLNAIWSYTMQMELLASPGEQGARARHLLSEVHKAARSWGWDSEQTDAELRTFRRTTGALSAKPGVQRLKIASPLEAVLAAVVSEVKPLGYVLTGVYGIERVLRLVMEWQAHRANLADRSRETMSESAARTQDAVERGKLATAIAERLSRHGDNGIPLRSDQDEAVSALAALSVHRIVEVRVTSSGEPENAQD
ncbi:hypothetical protein ACIBTZ_28560 [Micromonospora sp. NPDC049460]|uniref:hypothetical protein n=1 Tax=Micromonospora sp. NPDC049460 TaxID=3364272 RepID=UPI003791FC79